MFSQEGLQNSQRIYRNGVSIYNKDEESIEYNREDGNYRDAKREIFKQYENVGP